MDLDNMIQLAEDQARRVLLGTKDELTPMWLMVTGEGEVEIAGTPWNGDAEKRLVVEAMRNVMAKRQVIAYSFLVECWFAWEPATMKEYTGPRISDRADRQEGVVMYACNHFGEVRHKHLKIIRDKKGKCVELQRLDGPEDRITGLFDNLIDRRRPQ